jgi:hypothetical protein
MKIWTGKVTKKFHRDFQGTKLYSFQLEGTDRWFRTGKEMLPFDDNSECLRNGGDGSCCNLRDDLSNLSKYIDNIIYRAYCWREDGVGECPKGCDEDNCNGARSGRQRAGGPAVGEERGEG